MIAVAAVALAAGVTGAALATTTSSASSATDTAATPTPAPSASRHWPGARGPMGGPFHGAPFHGGGFFAGPGGVVHGQVVVPAGGGKFRTEDTQRGSVTAVSTSSITVQERGRLHQDVPGDQLHPGGRAA